MESEANKSDVRVIGLDPSLTGTGVVVMDGFGHLVDLKVFSSKACGSKVHERMERFNRLVESVRSIVAAENPSIICIEGYSYGSSTGGVSDRVEYGGLLRHMLWRFGHIEIHEVVPTSLKKWSTGKGKGDKTPVIAALTKRYGVVFESDNEYDAYALARIALQIEGHEAPENVPQSEVINTVLHGSAKKQKKESAKTAKKKPIEANTASQLF